MSDATPLSADQKIEQLLAALKKQRDEFDAAEALTKRPWRTNCSFGREGLGGPVNIVTASQSVIVNLMTELVMREQAAGTVTTLLGLPVEPVRHGQYTMEEWTADFRKRIAIIQLAEKRRKLDDQEARLNQLVSPERRREMELAALAAEIEG